MSTLTIKLNSLEIDNIEKMKIILDEKTSTGVIRKMIKNHEELINNRNKLKREKSRLISEKYALKSGCQKYFEAMHELMRDCDYDAKL